MTYVIAQPCVDVKDKACIDECPVDCIYEGERSLYIHPSECVDCGACDPVCPVEAIYYSDDVPDEWADYVRANVEFFEELGSPQGASALGNLAGTTRWFQRHTSRADVRRPAWPGSPVEATPGWAGPLSHRPYGRRDTP
ncbi:ferredoxin [Arthrobacter sp. Hiyo8]|nr:ferredoxin [Arthrobacter sp. Hiyo8]